WCRSLDKAERLIGALLGEALGDALGFVVEAQPPEAAQSYVDEWLRRGRAGERSSPHYPFGQYSDDTQLARELLLSFRERRLWDPEDYAHRLAQLFGHARDVGAGSGTRSAALRILQGLHWSRAGTPAPYAGNGSAIRAGPLGLLFSDLATIARVAREQSRITHLDPRCGAGAVAVALAVFIAGRKGPIVPGQFLHEIAAAVEQDDLAFAQALRSCSEWISLTPGEAARQLQQNNLDPAYPKWQGVSAFVVPSVIWSLYSFLRSPDDYWETVCTAIAVGGDTDSTAAMAGAMSGARGGPAELPEGLLGRLTDRGEWGAGELTLLARDCAGISWG
ncbi:MAG: ADP-ribosylglycohydrolase family protein, partial [Gemmatimonadales bacterium]